MDLQCLLLTCVVAAVTGGQQPRTSENCPEYDRVEYSAPRADWPGRITVENLADMPPRATEQLLEVQRSPHGTASYTVQEPDTTKPGPWTTVVEVTGNKARPLHLRIRFVDHAYDVQVRWLNEQLLWLQMWRGRIVSADSILNVDSGQFLYQKDADYGILGLPCSTKLRVPR